jgi:MFS family permease
LRKGIFSSLWFASLLSNIGTLVQTVGAAWLMVSLTPSSNMVAFVQGASALPVMLLSIPAGAVADIWDRRSVMLLAIAIMGVTSALLTALAFNKGLSPWSLLGFTFLLGCGSALYGPAWQSSVGEQVATKHLPAAVSLNAISFNIARTVGPAIGGFIVATSGSQAAFLFNTLSYTGLIIVLARWRRRRAEPILPPESIVAALGTGLRYARLSPAIKTVLIRSFIFGLFGSGIWATIPLIARDLLVGGPMTFGFLLGSFGVGAVGGALGSTWLRRSYDSNTIVTSGSLIFGIATIVVAQSQLMLLSVIALLFAGAAWVLSFSTLNISTQTSAPRWVVGRTLAIYQTAAFGGVALGSWLWGELAETVGLSISLTAAGTLLVASCFLVQRWPMHPASLVKLDPLRLAGDVPGITGLEPEAGPIVISTEYRILTTDAPRFLEVIYELGRIRRRDGARRWSVLQDLGDQTCWVERFETVTWLDYLRHQHRATLADRETEERVLALHQGAEAPKMRFLRARSAAEPFLADALAPRPYSGGADSHLGGG